MANRNRSVVHRVGRAPRRESVWLEFAPTSTTVAASTAVLVFSLNAAALALEPFTVIRTRGLLQLTSDQEAAAENSRLGFGIAVVSDQATAIGVTAVPTPITDMGSDLWFVYELMFHNFTPTPAGIGPNYNQHRFDSKAMRKVDIGQDIVVTVEQQAAVGSILAMGFRMLIKLH